MKELSYLERIDFMLNEYCKQYGNLNDVGILMDNEYYTNLIKSDFQVKSDFQNEEIITYKNIRIEVDAPYSEDTFNAIFGNYDVDKSICYGDFSGGWVMVASTEKYMFDIYEEIEKKLKGIKQYGCNK